MLANTGTVSFVIYGIFVAITIAAMVIAFKLIKNGTYETEKLDKLIELFKYTIVSVAIATTTLVISDLFKEREQDVKELQYFDTYAQDMKKVDGIQERYQLSKYLSIVAPNGEMKASWAQYYDSVKVEYKEYLRLKKEEIILNAVATPNKEQIAKKEEVTNKITLQESPLVSIEKTTPAKKDSRVASMHEELGYEFLLAKNINDAINAFNKSENAYNGYHQVYEIAKYLRINKDKLNSADADAEWKKIYSGIASKYSIYASTEIKKELKLKSK